MHTSLSLSPRKGGGYTSSNLRLRSSVRCSADVVLGANWLVSCRIIVGSTALRRPTPESVMVLTEGHGWTADGTLHFNPEEDFVDLASRLFFLPFSWERGRVWSGMRDCE